MDIRIPAQGDAYDVSRMALTPSTASFSTSLMRNADNSIMLSDDAVRCSSEDQCSQSKNETNATTGSAALMQDSMPALNLPNIDFSSMKPNFRSSNEDSLHGIRRPIAIRPSSLNSSYHLAVRSSVTGAPDARQDRSYPLLEIVLDEENDGIDEHLPSFSKSRNDLQMPLYVPQLCIKPVMPKKEVPSPIALARRGAEERAYLQGQMNAEALQRKKQKQHNEERRRRESQDNSRDEKFIDDICDEEIQTMLEKFQIGKSIEGESDELQSNVPKMCSCSRDALRNFAASPPAILKTQFKRSVSAVLADS